MHSLNDQLGITSRADMMNLCLECSSYCRQKPGKRAGSFAPEFDIPKLVLEGHLEEGLTIKQITPMLSISERTVYR